MPTTYSVTEQTTTAVLQAISFMQDRAVALGYNVQVGAVSKLDPTLQPK